MIESMFYTLIEDERKVLEQCLYTIIYKSKDCISNCESIRFRYGRKYRILDISMPYDEFSEGKFRPKFRNNMYYLNKFMQQRFGISKHDDRK